MVPPLQASFRSRANYAVAWASELGAPLLGLWAARKAGGRVSSPPQTWKKGLLLGANHIGDILYRSCSLSELAAGLPDCRWDIVAPFPASDVLEGNPAIRKIHRFELPLAINSDEAKVLSIENYDVAICYDSGMYVHPLRLSVELGIPNRVAYNHKGFSAWVTHPVNIFYPQPFSCYFRDLVAGITGRTIAADVRPQIFPTEDDRRMADQWLKKAGLRADVPLVAMFASTRQPTGIWPIERFAAVAKALHDRCWAQVVLCGGSEDASFLSGLRERYQLVTPVMAGDLNLRALTCFLARCRAVLCPDSGSRHLANAAGTRVFFFRNLRSNAIETGKYCETETDLSPEGEFLLPDQQQKTLENISVDWVLERMRFALR